MRAATVIWNSGLAANWRELTLVLVGVLCSIGASALVEAVRPAIDRMQ